jgi:hypothetical protein
MESQLDLFEGNRRKEQGLAVVEANNENFVERMRRIAREISAREAYVTADDLRKFDDDEHPHSPNAWGAIFKGRGWLCLGFSPSAYILNHGRVIRRWKWIG